MQLVAALKKVLVEADFKSVTYTFVNQGIAKDEIDTYLNFFKSLKDSNRIKTHYEKNIDYWGKKPWEEFKKFIDELQSTISKTKEKKLHKMEGAKLIAESKLWSVYHILTYEASKLYGSGTKWCISERSNDSWNLYAPENNIYFIISKIRKSNDIWYKIALLIDRKGNKTYWDSWNGPYSVLPAKENFNIPKFKTEVPS